jgi:outer membrane beta-barrel protein
MRTFKSLKTWLAATALVAGLHTPAAAADHPAGIALKDAQTGKGPLNAVQNRFFLKEGRIETTPVLGYVPSDPLVQRYVGGLIGAYHFSETLAAEGIFLYSPDLGENDLKGLTHTLVSIAASGNSGGNFQQPLDKMIMGATFATRWAPFYGKINLIGESVLNFDAYGTLGMGMLTLKSYLAVENTDDPDKDLKLNPAPNPDKVVIAPTIGIGFNFFLNQSMALKLDARNYFYIANEPAYDPENPPDGQRLYNNFVATVGLSFFIPEMKKRMYNF